MVLFSIKVTTSVGSVKEVIMKCICGAILKTQINPSQLRTICDDGGIGDVHRHEADRVLPLLEKQHPNEGFEIVLDTNVNNDNLCDNDNHVFISTTKGVLCKRIG